jgi:hypothetical protein
MIFRYQRGCMEIGLINALSHAGNGNDHDEHEEPPHRVHIPRILTVTDGLVTGIFDLRTRENELDKIRNWTIEVTDPNAPSVSVYQVGETFDRLADPQPDPRDFRWITDFEAPDLHDRILGRELDTRKMLMVLYVRQGEFYTKMKSVPLRKVRVDGSVPPQPFGSVAEITACDISFQTGEVRLVAGGAGGTVVFPFEAKTNRIYEFTNTPPDVPVEGPSEPDENHFHLYYDKLFNRTPPDQFRLESASDPDPAPDPLLCGAGGLGRRDDPL